MLIVIASVAITLSLSENGIFNKATEAKLQYINAEVDETASLDQMTNQIDVIASSSRETVTVDKAEYEQLKADVATLKNTPGMTTKDLWKGTAVSCNQIELSESYKNFDVIYFYVEYRVDDCYSIFPTLTSKISEYSSYSRGILCTVYDTYFVTLYFNSDTKIKVTSSGSSGEPTTKLVNVVGVKY